MGTKITLSTTQVTQFPVKDLLPDPDQPRQDFGKEALQALADNIKQRGVQVPLLVRVGGKDGKQTVIKDGERRWRAAKLAKLASVPVLLVKAADAAQIRIDQVSVNNLREQLKPMDLARTLSKMREVDKLTANDIAARMDKQGLPMTQAHITNLMKLVELPAWAQTMVDNEEIDVAAAREIAGIADKQVLPELAKGVKQALNWRGRVTVSEVGTQIRIAYGRVGIDLKKTESYHSKPVFFDYKKICKGCPALRELRGEAFCMDQAGFNKHQAEAKEAGLGPGGKKASAPKAAAEKKLSPAQQKKLDAVKEKQRASSLEDKTKYYLHSWARARIQAYLPTDPADLAQRLVEFAAADRPGLTQDGVYIPHHVKNKYASKMRRAAAQHGYSALPNFLKAEDGGGEMYDALATELVDQLPLTETLEIAHHVFGADITPLWKVDAEYLDLLQKSELAQVAEKNAQLPDGRKAWAGLKVEELKAAILAVADKVGVPPALAKLYAKPEPRDPDDLEEDFDDGDDDESQEDVEGDD
jgi:ParB/RepB/Spo0J family partition protein